MIRVAVTDPGLQALTLAGLRHQDLLFMDAPSGVLPPPDDLHFWHAPDGSGVLLVHDFPEGDFEEIRRIAGESRDLRIFAVIRPPAIMAFWEDRMAGAVLEGFLVVAPGEGVSAEELGRTFQKAHSRIPRDDLVRLLRERFDLDATLDRVLIGVVHARNPIRTVARVQDDFELSERELIGSVRRAGFATPGQFLMIVRSLMALGLVRRGYTVKRAAEVVGYGTVATLARHTRRLFNASPGAAAGRWSSAELLMRFDQKA